MNLYEKAKEAVRLTEQKLAEERAVLKFLEEAARIEDENN
jgi:hypothetical protein